MADKKIHPGFKKNAKVIVGLGAVAIAATAIAFVTIKDKRKAPAAIDVPAIDTRGSTQSAETPNYARALENVNNQGFQKAEHTDATFIPTLSERGGKSTPLEDDLAKREKENPPQAQRDYARPNQTPVAQTATGTPANPPQVDQAVMAQVKLLQDQWTSTESSQDVLGLAQQTAKVDGRAATQSAQTVAAGNAGSGETSGAKQLPYIHGLDQIPAVYANSIDTDAPSDVLATVETGKYAGSILYGTARLSNEVVVTEFTKMQTPSKDFLSITAVALDENELRTAQPADIDHRYAQRIAIPAVMGALGMIGSVYSNAGATVQNTPLGGTTVIQNPNPTTKQVAGAAGAGALQATQQVIQQETSTIPPRRGRIKKGTPIMVLFKNDVFLK